MARALVNEVKDSQRNYLINSLMEIRQRYGGAISGAITASQTYKVHDRWITYINNAGFFSSAAHGPTVITDPVSGATIDALNFNANASNASAEGYVVQRIEGRFAKELVGKKVSISFLVRNNNFTTVRVRLYYANAFNNFTGGQTQFHLTSSQVFTANSTVKSVEFPDMVTVPVQAQNGIAVEIIYSGFSVGVTDDTALSKIMFNEGSTCATFSTYGHNFDQELIACQRYFEKSYSQANGPGQALGGVDADGALRQQSFGDGTFRWHAPFKVSKLKVPTMTFYNPNTGSSSTPLATDGSGNVSLTLVNTSEQGFSIERTGLAANTTSRTHYTADAEL